MQRPGVHVCSPPNLDICGDLDNITSPLFPRSGEKKPPFSGPLVGSLGRVPRGFTRGFRRVRGPGPGSGSRVGVGGPGETPGFPRPFSGGFSGRPRPPRGPPTRPPGRAFRDPGPPGPPFRPFSAPSRNDRPRPPVTGTPRPLRARAGPRTAARGGPRTGPRTEIPGPGAAAPWSTPSGTPDPVQGAGRKRSEFFSFDRTYSLCTKTRHPPSFGPP